MATSFKKYSGITCPHGTKVFAVDGVYVRDNLDSDFCQGGNGYAYNFIPKDEIWIDDVLHVSEWPFIIYHECTESEFMKQGLSYDQAHDKAKAKEDAFRADAGF